MPKGQTGEGSESPPGPPFDPSNPPSERTGPPFEPEDAPYDKHGPPNPAAGWGTVVDGAQQNGTRGQVGTWL